MGESNRILCFDDSLGEILKAYAKEVIRQQPENIYEFSARYFAQLDQHEAEYDEGKK